MDENIEQLYQVWALRDGNLPGAYVCGFAHRAAMDSPDKIPSLWPKTSLTGFTWTEAVKIRETLKKDHYHCHIFATVC